MVYVFICFLFYLFYFCVALTLFYFVFILFSALLFFFSVFSVFVLCSKFCVACHLTLGVGDIPVDTINQLKFVNR